MDTWLTQPNFPLISISSKKDGYRLSQSPFVLGDSSSSQRWPIPLGSKDHAVPQLMEAETLDISTSEPLQLNVGNSAHFVTDYDTESLSMLRDALAQGNLSAVDRLSLLHETSLLARAGHSSAAELWRLALTYKQEPEEPVWDIISLAIADLKRFVETHKDAEARFKTHINDLARPIYNRLGWEEKENELESDTKLRATALGLMTYAEEPSIIEEGLKLFRASDNLDALKGEMRGVILAIAGKCGSSDDWQRMFDLYQTTQIADLQQDILGAITLTKDAAQIKKMLVSISDESIVRSQDVDRWFAYLIRNRYARESTWEWMTTHWKWIEDKFDSDKSYDSFPRYAASSLSTFEWKRRYDEFFEPLLPQPALTRAIELGSKDIEGRALWIERDGSEFLAELTQ